MIRRSRTAAAMALRLVATIVLPAVSACQPDRGCLSLPVDFVHLRKVDPSIIQDIRYATDRNFVGSVVDGYDAPECILRLEAARALSKVQDDLLPRGYSLKVYDCYRPKRAVEHFMRWSRNDDNSTKSAHYPGLTKRDLIGGGYIAANSSHSLGISLDLTVVELRTAGTAATNGAKGIQPHAPLPDRRPPGGDVPVCRTPASTPHAEYRELEMGTSFDCFDERSHTLNPNVTETVLRNRMILKTAMEKHGFENYAKEWWHFSYDPLERSSTRHDFPIRPFKGCEDVD